MRREDDAEPGYASWFKDRRTASQALSPRLLRLQSLASGRGRKLDLAKPRGVRDHDILSPSENNLIELARQDIIIRRHCAGPVKRRQRTIFLLIGVMTVFFPLIGLLALWHRFDSTISWHTRGELHGLTDGQRRMLRWQLLIETILYTALVIVLAVYYSLRD
jgi:hypothetical protein